MEENSLARKVYVSIMSEKDSKGRPRKTEECVEKGDKECGNYIERPKRAIFLFFSDPEKK